jgi:hypothetical protein
VKESGATPASIAEAIVGISRASAEASRTPAQVKMRQYLGPTHKTIEQAEQAALRREIRNGVKAGGPIGAQQIRDAVNAGQLSEKQLENAVRTARLTGLQFGFRSLTIGQALEVYKVATPDERASLEPFLRVKAENFLKSASPAAIKEMGPKIREALQKSGR